MKKVKNRQISYSVYISVYIVAIFLSGCQILPESNGDGLSPLSDPKNKSGWVLNADLSDEFEAETLDTEKWWAQGTDGVYYKWKGRAPSQFTPDNVRLEEGKLKIATKWQPDFNFAKGKFDKRKYENITTAGVISRKRFLYGYMEIKSKAADAAMTSSFWTLGYQSELDMFEQMGAPKLEENIKENSYMFSIHDWRPGVVAGENKVFTHNHMLDFRVADDFHVYGCEWGENYLKFYVDGKLVYETTKDALGDAWVLTNPLELWFDSETFYWLGHPEAHELPVDFEIDYVRVWQKPNTDLLYKPFFGFEGPIYLKEVPVPTKTKSFEKFWRMNKAAKLHLDVVSEKSASGRKSLKFTHDGKLKRPVVSANAPRGTVKLPAGEFELSMQVWVEPNSSLAYFDVKLEQTPLRINLEGVERGKWLRLTQTFTREAPSRKQDRLSLVFKRAAIGKTKTAVYIDDIEIHPLKK